MKVAHKPGILYVGTVHQVGMCLVLINSCVLNVSRVTVQMLPVPVKSSTMISASRQLHALMKAKAAVGRDVGVWPKS